MALLNGLLALATALPVMIPHPLAVFASGGLFGSVFLSVVASTTAPFQLEPALMPKRLFDGVPSAAVVRFDHAAANTLEEAVALREQGVGARLLLLGDREERELPWCIAHDLTCCVSEPRSVVALGQLAARAGKRVPVHLKINTGMNRYGVRWNEAASLAALVGSTKSLLLEGVLSHFAQSDETDKTFALQQLARFEQALREIAGQSLASIVRRCKRLRRPVPVGFTA